MLKVLFYFIIIKWVDLIDMVSTVDLNSNDYSKYANHESSSRMKFSGTLKFDNGSFSEIDLQTGKIFKSHKVYKYEQNIGINLFEFNSTSTCKDNMNDLYKFYHENLNFQPNFLYKIEDGFNVILRCPVCDLRTEVIWIRKGFMNSRHETFKFNPSQPLNRILVGQNNTLLIKSFQLTDSGIYSCVHKNLYDNLTYNKSLDKNIFETFHNVRIANSNKKFANSSDPLFMIKIYLFHSLKIFSAKKHLIFNEKLSHIKMYKRLKLNRRNLTYIDKNSDLKFYALWTNWGICNYCTLEKRHRKRSSECRVIYTGNLKFELFELNKIFNGYGWPCSFVSTYYDLVSNEIFDKIPNDLIELNECICEKNKHGLYEDEYLDDDDYDDDEDYEDDSYENREIAKGILKEFKLNTTNMTIFVVEKFTGDDITLKCLELDYHDVAWKKSYGLISNKDKNRISKRNITHLLSNELVIKDLNLTDSGLYTCYRDKKAKEALLVIKLKITPLRVKKAFLKLEDNYELMQPTLLMIGKFITGIVLFSLINQTVSTYFQNVKLKEKTNRHKKECYFIQKFLKINLEQFEKSLENKN